MTGAVGVEAVVAEESDEGLAGGAGELDGEAGRGGDSGDEGDAGREGFLDDFEGDPSGKEEDVLSERERALKDGVSDDLVDGVVAPDVLAQDPEVPAEVEQGGGMEPTGGIESGLCRPHAVRQREQPLGRDGEGVVDGRMALPDCVDGGLATQAAGGNGKHVPGQTCEVDDEVGAKLDVEDRAMRIARVTVETRDVGGVAQEAFGDKEAGGEFLVVPRCAERDGHRARIDADFEGFLDGELVVAVHPAALRMVGIDIGRRRGLRTGGVRHGGEPRRWGGA